MERRRNEGRGRTAKAGVQPAAESRVPDHVCILSTERTKEIVDAEGQYGNETDIEGKVETASPGTGQHQAKSTVNQPDHLRPLNQLLDELTSAAFLRGDHP